MTTTTHFWERLARGETRREWWEPSIARVPTLPVLAARGQRDGPTVVITGAVHGDEYEGPAAIHMFFNQLDTAQLAGRVIGLPVVNGAAWAARARLSPTDCLDLNRLFPGSQDAEPSRALAETIFTHFVHPGDVLIDLHSGGAKLVHLPMIGWYAEGGEAERLGRSFAQSMFPWRPGPVAGVLSYEAHRAGKLAMGAEWGGGARLDPVGAATYATGLRRTLAHLAGESPEPHFVDRRPQLVGSYQATVQAGLFRASGVELGMRVTPDTTLGWLTNDLGEIVGEVKAERAGTLAALAHVALLDAGDRIAYIG